MVYELEKWIPLVKDLAEKYTSKESSSISYTTAQQLLGAIMYCVNENDLEIKENALQNQINALYEEGYQLVLKKIKKAQEEYNKISEKFESYGNIAYEETFKIGLLEFFKRYDAKFYPQNHIITMDYKVLVPLEHLQGIDIIYQYILCIKQEQIFLQKFPIDYVKEVLIMHHIEYEQLFLNISGVVLKKVLCNMLCEQKIEKVKYEKEDYKLLENKIKQLEKKQLCNCLNDLLKILIGEIYENSKELFYYLKVENKNIAVELKNAVENNKLQMIL